MDKNKKEKIPGLKSKKKSGPKKKKKDFDEGWRKILAETDIRLLVQQVFTRQARLQKALDSLNLKV